MPSSAEIAAIRHGFEERMSAAGEYYAPDNVLRSICHGIKEGDRKSIVRAASLMKDLVRPGDTLIPIPSRNGKATTTLAMSEELARLTGCKVADILVGNDRQSMYALKKSGTIPPTSYMGFRLKGPVPEHPVFVDNVIATGTTGRAALELVPGSRLIALANASEHRPDLALPGNYMEIARGDSLCDSGMSSAMREAVSRAFDAIFC